jgi:hypothetical protein
MLVGVIYPLSVVHEPGFGFHLYRSRSSFSRQRFVGLLVLSSCLLPVVFPAQRLCFAATVPSVKDSFSYCSWQFCLSVIACKVEAGFVLSHRIKGLSFLVSRGIFVVVSFHALQVFVKCV